MGNIKISKELLKGTTVILVLNCINSDTKYGYEIVKEIVNHSDGMFALKEGTLYPILHGLEKDGFVKSFWREVGGRNRKYYKLTAAGKKQLESKRIEWSIFSSVVNNVLGRINNNEVVV